MKTEKTPEKDNPVIYRKDGKTPDFRYKSSKDYVSSQNIEKDKQIPVQIKPVGKKPVWKKGS